MGESEARELSAMSVVGWMSTYTMMHEEQRSSRGHSNDVLQ